MALAEKTDEVVSSHLASENFDEPIRLDLVPKWIVYFGTAAAVALSIFQLYTSLTGIYQTAMVHYAVHLMLVLVIFFSIRKPLAVYHKHYAWLDAGITIASLYSLGYVIFYYNDIVSIVNPEEMSLGQMASAWLILALLLYAVFRMSLGFFILSVIALLYALFGNFLPGVFQHPGLDLERLVYLTSFSSDGIFGTSLSVSATYLFLFIFFGVVLERTGTGSFFIDSSQSLVGRFTGGSAKTALFASAGLGSVVGSSIGNVVAAGSMTIPLMKKTGFRPHVAAAIESVASEGGQLLPPVLGAGAFIMAEITGILYADIALSATIPAILYFLSVYFVIHFEAKKFGLKGLPKEELPRFWQVMKEKGHLAFSIVILFYLLVFEKMGTTKAGFYAIVAAVILAMLRKNTRMNLKQFRALFKEGAIAAVEVAVLCAAMGILAGVLVFTGLGVQLSDIILSFTNQDLFWTLFASMIISIILGMGLPTPVAYLISALFVAPALIDIGVPELAAHMFLFFFAIKSGVTPPIAIVAVVAAGIAKANWLKTANLATLYSLPSFIIAYQFAYQPSLLMDGVWSQIIFTFVTASIGVVGIAGAIQGWWLRKVNWIERVLLGAFSLLLVTPDALQTTIGIIGVVVITVMQWLERLRNQKTAQLSQQINPIQEEIR